MTFTVIKSNPRYNIIIIATVISSGKAPSGPLCRALQRSPGCCCRWSPYPRWSDMCPPPETSPPPDAWFLEGGGGSHKESHQSIFLTNFPSKCGHFCWFTRTRNQICIARFKNYPFRTFSRICLSTLKDSRWVYGGRAGLHCMVNVHCSLRETIHLSEGSWYV